jgi:hypothetical protein
MTTPDVAVVVQPAGHTLSTVLLPQAATAAGHLELGRWLARIVLILDDLSADERPWLTVATTDAGRALTLYLHPDAVLRDRPDSTSRPAPQDAWTLRPTPRVERVCDPAEFSPVKAQRLLHHHFLWARDLCDGSLDPCAVPSSLAEAFQEAWAVGVDGRLRRAGAPAIGEGERRFRFLRLFATAGVITPVHWRIFHELWTTEAPTSAEVLRHVRLLPPLRWNRRGDG